MTIALAGVLYARQLLALTGVEDVQHSRLNRRTNSKAW